MMTGSLTDRPWNGGPALQTDAVGDSAPRLLLAPEIAFGRLDGHMALPTLSGCEHEYVRRERTALSLYRRSHNDRGRSPQANPRWL